MNLCYVAMFPLRHKCSIRNWKKNKVLWGRPRASSMLFHIDLHHTQIQKMLSVRVCVCVWIHCLFFGGGWRCSYTANSQQHDSWRKEHIVDWLPASSSSTSLQTHARTHVRVWCLLSAFPMQTETFLTNFIGGCMTVSVFLCVFVHARMCVCMQKSLPSPQHPPGKRSRPLKDSSQQPQYWLPKYICSGESVSPPL